MSRRVKHLWTVEVYTPRGYEPCYEAEVNSSREWADKNRQALQKKYSGSKYRVAKYEVAAIREKSRGEGHGKG